MLFACCGSHWIHELGYHQFVFQPTYLCIGCGKTESSCERCTAIPNFRSRVALTNEIANRKQVSPTEPSSRLFKYKTTLITTETCVQYYFLLILVLSAPSNVQRKRDIRQTWGVDYAMKPRWKTAFLVAPNLLLKEDEIFGDLVRAG